MYPSLIFEYIDWCDRGYLDPSPVKCRECDLYMLASASPDSILLQCGLCKYKKHIGLYEYKKLQALVLFAKNKFAGE